MEAKTLTENKAEATPVTKIGGEGRTTNANEIRQRIVEMESFAFSAFCNLYRSLCEEQQQCEIDNTD